MHVDHSAHNLRKLTQQRLANISLGLPAPRTDTTKAFSFRGIAIHVNHRRTKANQPTRSLSLPTRLTILLFRKGSPHSTDRISTFFLARLLHFHGTQSISRQVPTDTAIHTLQRRRPRAVMLTRHLQVRINRFTNTASHRRQRFSIRAGFIHPIRVNPTNRSHRYTRIMRRFNLPHHANLKNPKYTYRNGRHSLTDSSTGSPRSLSGSFTTYLAFELNLSKVQVYAHPVESPSPYLLTAPLPRVHASIPLSRPTNALGIASLPSVSYTIAFTPTAT